MIEVAGGIILALIFLALLPIIVQTILIAIPVAVVIVVGALVYLNTRSATMEELLCYLGLTILLGWEIWVIFFKSPSEIK